MTAAIVWLILWLVLAWVGAWVIIALMTLAGSGLALIRKQPWIALGFAVVGWAVGFAWWVYAIVHFALQIASIVGLITG